MSRKFRQVASEEEYIDVFSPILSKFDGLLAHYTQNSPNAVETSRDIRNLMPLHPATALLATFYAREAGSASRSVFEFLGDNKTIREFLDSENIFLNRHTITADYLWIMWLTSLTRTSQNSVLSLNDSTPTALN